MYVCHKSTKYRASQVGGRELSCNIWPRELDDDFFLSRPRFGLQAKGWKVAIRRLPVVDVGDKESWNIFGGEKESNMDAIFERSREEGVR